MDLRFHDIDPSDSERAAVDSLLGEPDSSWVGGLDRDTTDMRVVHGGRDARDQRHLLLPVLATVQSEIGWISRGALDYICKRLSVPPAEAYGVASFYALLSTERRPRRTIHVCDDIGCRSFGGSDVVEAMKAAVGPAGTERDGVTWLTSPCLGQCDRAPAIFAQVAGSPDEVLAPVGAIDDVIGGRPGDLSVTVPQAGDPGLRLLRRVGTVDPTSLDAYRAAGGYEALAAAVAMGAAAVVSEVKASGLRGRGGAAFPCGVKWEAVAGEGGPKHLICNADESEPGTFKDRVLMEGDPFGLIESMTIAGYATGCESSYIYIRGEYPQATVRLTSAIDQARAAGFLGTDVGGHGFAFDIELRRGQGAYICGEETALMESIEGRRGEPRNKPPFPTQKGLFGRPTVINNVETLMNVPDIVTRGGAAFADIGTRESTGPKLFCLSGHVAIPGVYEVPFGATLGDLIDLAGGVSGNGELAAILLGGAAGSFVDATALDMPLTFEDSRSRNAALGSGVILVFDTTTDFADTTRRIAEFFRDESCGQCVPCRVGTVRQEEQLATHLETGVPLNLGLMGDIKTVMADASICGLGHTAATAIHSAFDLGLLEAR